MDANALSLESFYPNLHCLLSLLVNYSEKVVFVGSLTCASTSIRICIVRTADI